MSIVVVGADSLGGIEKNLYSMGVTKLVHISGRKASDRGINIPKATDCVLIMTDYINHGMMKNIKLAAKAREIPMVYAKRSWREVEEKLRAHRLFGGADKK